MDEMVEIDVEVLKMTDNGVLVTDGDSEAWVGYSLISKDSDINEYSDEEDTGVLIIPDWKAKKIGFI